MSSDVNAFTSQLIGVIKAAISKFVFKAKPSQYAKSWWSKNSGKLCSEYRLYRNQKLQAYYQNYKDRDLEQEAQLIKRIYYKKLQSLKKLHWNNFFEDWKNIWQASKYMTNQNATALFCSISFFQKSEITSIQKS